MPLLGDVHYDRPPIDTFHSEFRLRHEADGMFGSFRGEFESFSSMWGADGRSAALVATRIGSNCATGSATEAG